MADEGWTRRAAEEVPGVLATEKLAVRRSGIGYRVTIHVQTDPDMPLHAAHVLGVRGADEEVVRPVQRAGQVAEALSVLVGECARLETLPLGGLRTALGSPAAGRARNRSGRGGARPRDVVR